MITIMHKIVHWISNMCLAILIIAGFFINIMDDSIFNMLMRCAWATFIITAIDNAFEHFIKSKAKKESKEKCTNELEADIEITLQSLRENILKGIALADAELIKRKAGIEGESTIDQIENVILPELRQLLEKVDNEELPPRSERNLQSVLYFFKIWEWDRQNPTDLYKQLERINKHYKKVLAEL